MSNVRVLALLAAVGCSKGSDLEGIDYTQFPLASGARIEKVSIFQGVEKTLYRANGVFSTGSRPPPIIADREALLRVHVGPEEPEAWVPRELAVVIEYDDGSFDSVAPEVLTVGSEGWDQADLGTTATLRIPPERINPDMKLTVSVRETSGTPGPETPDAPQLWSSETQGLDVQDSDVIVVHVVPIRYEGDGSGRLPDTGPDTINEIRSRFFAMYPVRDVAVVVDEPLPWSNRITAFTGWETLLLEMSRRRTEASVPENTYFYALFNPADDLQEFCGAGCILGLSLLAFNPGDTWGRASMGLGFRDVAVDTMLHEVGHAHGREHAPCSLFGQPSDPGYPYQGAQLGAWGFDVVEQALVDPVANTDMMGYCQPIWVSDYTFTALYERVSALRGLRSSSERLDWQMLAVKPDGSAELGGIAQARALPGGEVAMFDLVDASGAVVGETEGFFLPFDHLDGGIALIEPQRRSVVSARMR